MPYCLLPPNFRQQQDVKVFLNANGKGAGGRCEVEKYMECSLLDKKN